MVYLQHRVSPHSYSRVRRWDRRCRQSAHFCLQAPLPQTRPVIMGLSPPDHAPHNTRCRPPSSRRCGPGRSGRPPGQLRPRRLVCIMAATARGPLDAESTRTPSSCSGGGGRGAIQRFHPDRWIDFLLLSLHSAVYGGGAHSTGGDHEALGTTKPPT